MDRLDRLFEGEVSRLGGFQYKKNFLCLDKLSFPTINRLNSGGNIRTGSQLCIHHFFANPYRFFLIFCRNKNNKDFLC